MALYEKQVPLPFCPIFQGREAEKMASELLIITAQITGELLLLYVHNTMLERLEGKRV